LQSTDKALYLPRLTTAQLNAQTGWKEGMMVYNTDSNCVFFRGSTKWDCVGIGDAWGVDGEDVASDIMRTGSVGFDQLPQSSTVLDMSEKTDMAVQLPNVALTDVSNSDASSPIALADLEDGMMVYNTVIPTDNNEVSNSSFASLNYTKDAWNNGGVGNTDNIETTPFGIEDHLENKLGFQFTLKAGSGAYGLVFNDIISVSGPFNVSFYIRKVGTGGPNSVDVRISGDGPTIWHNDQSVTTSYNRMDFAVASGTYLLDLFLGSSGGTISQDVVYQISGLQVSSGSTTLKSFSSEPQYFGKGVYRWSADLQRWHEPGIPNDDAWGVQGEDRINVAARVGKTGIGTLDPKTQLHVAEGENHGGVWFEVPADGKGANLVIGDSIPYDNGPELLIKTNNPTQVLYDNNGFGRSTGILYHENDQFTGGLRGRKTVFMITSESSSVFRDVAFANMKVNTDSTGYGFRWYTNRSGNGVPHNPTSASLGVEIMRLHQNGNLTIAGSLTQNSDVRLKKNFRSIEKPLQKLSAVNAFYYNWKDEGRDTITQIGFKAQELEKIFPELVSENEEGYKNVNYVSMIPILLEGMKELKSENEELKARLKKIENSIGVK